jgi:hypothetical protein
MNSMSDLGSLILNIVAVVCPIQLTPSRSVRNRLNYLKGFSLVLSCLFCLILMITSDARGALLITSVTPLSYCLIAALSVFSVQRTNDLRWSRWLNLVIVLPFVSLGWCMVLCVARKNPGPGSPAFHKFSAEGSEGTGRRSARLNVRGIVETNALL